VTSFYVYVLLIGATFYCRIPQLRSENQSEVVVGGLLQFIPHVYMVISLRVSNQGLLDNVTQWGFGQILARIMAGSTVVECAKSLEGE